MFAGTLSGLDFGSNGRQCLTQALDPTRSDSLGAALLSRENLAALEAWDMGAAG